MAARTSDLRAVFVRNLSGYLFALAATMIWSGNFIVARGLAFDIGPASLAFLRWATALVVLAPFAWPAVRAQAPLLRANLGHLVAAAFLGVTVFNTMIYAAARLTSATSLSLIAVFTPVWIILMARVFLGERMGAGRLCGVALAAFGVVRLTVRGEFATLAEFSFNAGDLLMLAATAVFAAYTVLVRAKPQAIGPAAYLGATFGLGLAMLAPFAALEWWLAPPPRFTPAMAGSVLYVGLGASLVSYLCWNRAVAEIGPGRAGVVYYSLPLFAGSLAALLLGEAVTPVHLVSGALIVGGIALANRRERRAAPEEG